MDVVESINKVRRAINNDDKTSEVSAQTKPFAVALVVKVSEPRSSWEMSPCVCLWGLLRLHQ